MPLFRFFFCCCTQHTHTHCCRQRRCASLSPSTYSHDVKTTMLHTALMSTVDRCWTICSSTQYLFCSQNAQIVMKTNFFAAHEYPCQPPPTKPPQQQELLLLFFVCQYLSCCPYCFVIRPTQCPCQLHHQAHPPHPSTHFRGQCSCTHRCQGRL